MGCLGLSSCFATTDDAGNLLRECRGEADADAHVEIVVDYDQSIHEMVACGGLNVTLVTSVTSGIIAAFVNNRPDATPRDWDFQGDGLYYTDGAGAQMTTRFFADADYSFAASGEPLTENLFLVDTYLVGARVEADIDIDDPLSSSVRITFDEPGPYAELLGYGEAPTSPIELDGGAWDRIEAGLRSLEFESEVSVDDVQSVSTVRYDARTSRMPVSGLLSGVGMGFELQMADASREDLGQSLIVEDWGIAFADRNPGALDGIIEFRVEGDAFTYYGSLSYDNDTYGTPRYTCE